MGYLVTSVVSLGALIKKNSKIVFIMIFLLLWVLIGLSVANPDYWNYKVVYDNINDETFLNSKDVVGLANESGFRLLYKIFYNLGFNYQMFLVIYSFAGLFLISKAIWKYSYNPNVIMIFYLIFPFTMDYVQIRTFMATAIVAYASKFLVSDEKKSIPKFVISVLLACTIHVSAIFYLMLILIRFLNLRQCYWFCCIGIFSLIFFYLNVDLIADILSVFLPANKIRSWLSGTTTRPFISSFGVVVVRISWMVLIEYFYRAYRRKVRKGIAERDMIVENLYKCNVILLVMLGLEIFTKQYERVGRITFLFGYIIFERLFEVRRTRALPWLFVLGVLGIYFAYLMFAGEVKNATMFEAVFQNMFEQNWLFQLFQGSS